MLTELQQVLIRVNQIKVYVKKVFCKVQDTFYLKEKNYDTMVEKSSCLSGLS